MPGLFGNSACYPPKGENIACFDICKKELSNDIDPEYSIQNHKENQNPCRVVSLPWDFWNGIRPKPEKNFGFN